MERKLVAVEESIVTRLRAAGCVFAEDEARVLEDSAAGLAELAGMVDRRVSGVPLEQVVGWAEFCGLRIVVAPGVFVPRRRTELLVRAAVRLVEQGGHRPAPVVVDLCCGSGAVGAALVSLLPHVEMHAADVDPVAAACARQNIGVQGQVHVGDLFDALPGDLRGRIDVVTANTPYVPTDALRMMPPEARLHEPRTALDGGPDGLDLARRVAAASTEWLAPGGRLLVETGEAQVADLQQSFARAGLDPSVSRCDDLDATAVIGTFTDR